MIKFFSRIRHSLVTENKFSKYLIYAIGEILLVVIGILIALQINNWNLNRINVHLEKQYCIRLLEDLKEEKAIMQATLNYTRQVHNHAKKAMLLFENPNNPILDPVESLVNLYQASQIQFPTSAKSTYQELIASSQINLIKNDSLKTSLIRYYEYNWAEASALNLPNEFRTSLRSKMPNEIQEEIRTNCGDIYVKIRKTYEVSLPKTCKISVPINVAHSIVEILRQDEDLKKNLRVLIGNLEAKINYIHSLEKHLQDLNTEFETATQ